jgi:cell filamentation protein
LEAFEEEIVKQRAGEPFPTGRLRVAHYRAIHRHLFQDVYTWAGRFRSVRIAKGESLFGYPEHIPTGMRNLFA